MTGINTVVELCLCEAVVYLSWGLKANDQMFVRCVCPRRMPRCMVSVMEALPTFLLLASLGGSTGGCSMAWRSTPHPPET